MGHRLLHEENIVSGLDAGNWEEALEKILARLPVWTLRGIEKQKILFSIRLREQIGTTAIGHGIALPHCFLSEAQEPIVAFGVSPSGVPYPSLDERLVHFIFLLILPRNDSSERQKREILTNIKGSLCDRYLQDCLKAARTASEIYQLLVPESQRVPALQV